MEEQSLDTAIKEVGVSRELVLTIFYLYVDNFLDLPHF